MRYLIDSNCCIYLFGGNYPELGRKIAHTEAGSIGLSVIVLAELAVGAHLGKAPADDRLTRLRQEMPLLPFEERDAEAYARLPFKRGRFDRLLAAHAVSRNLTLITNNEADFADIPGLKIENWTRP
ncbi:MAG TPA: type II toxin-antitoxin system VapC family toxin [Sphingomonas sp.]|uniref:type II toxin-antitoxin system VapC family toxin n=1 Tax=Sphingomonas sp. TaxID=28214 RepID=UPI002CD8D10C|nr:type II toxin-antitoxin system VapC family toxin [Sphingomonas sp.]HMI20527.1 type II toxin-antitoxin system VapC family toxin [Sphingomonas sp.]